MLSGVATGLVSQISNNLLGGAFGGATGGFGSSYKTFPGGSDSDPEANYGGKAFTLGLNGSDVVFSLQPANQGPQAFGLAQGVSFPTSITTLPFDQLTSMPPLVPNATANALKNGAMSDRIGKKAFSSSLSSNFNTSLSL